MRDEGAGEARGEEHTPQGVISIYYNVISMTKFRHGPDALSHLTLTPWPSSIQGVSVFIISAP